MSFKRRNTSSPEPEDSEPDDLPPAKRQRVSSEEDSGDDDEYEHPVGREQPRNDPRYGQKGAFPGLDDHGDELFYGPPSDGIEYLRMVR